jgi:hypothetical protein
MESFLIEMQCLLVAMANKCVESAPAQVPLSASTRIAHSTAVSVHQHMQISCTDILILRRWMRVPESFPLRVDARF